VGENGGDLYVLKDILGYKSITVTQRYAHLSPAYKRDAVNRMDIIWMGSTGAGLLPEAVPRIFPVTVRLHGPVGGQPDITETL
jgi:hypothetical protein